MKLALSILGPFLFLINYWVCEYCYSGSSESWDVFIPMDMLCHNFWAVIILVYALMNLFKIKKQITYYFIYLGICLSFFDVMSRLFSMSEYNPKWYILSLMASLILSGIFYAQRHINNSAK